MGYVIVKRMQKNFMNKKRQIREWIIENDRRTYIVISIMYAVAILTTLVITYIVFQLVNTPK